MIKLQDSNKQTLHLLKQVKDYYIESGLETADSLIHFTMLKSDAAYADIKQENYLLTDENRFVIKEINYKEKDYAEVFGKLDLVALKSTHIEAFDSTEKHISILLGNVLTGTGWTYSLHDIPSKLRTVRKEDTNAYEVIMRAMVVYGYEVRFDTLTNTVHVYQSMGDDRGSYVYSELNMKRLEFQSDTYDFRTRLYAYGKEGATFASINGGKAYIDNFQHSNKIIETVWRDERYTNMESLLADATERLANLSKPRLSYTVDLIQLTNLNPIYTILSYQLGDTVKIIEKENELIDTQRVVKLTSYPLTPEKNKIQLANAKLTFKASDAENSGSIGGVEEAVAEEGIKIRTDLMIEIEKSNALIKAENGGFVVIRYNENNQPYEQLIMNTDDVATATQLWRWNVNGLGYSSTGYNGSYKLAITADGRINADFITTGFLSANRIKAGLLSSNEGNSYINLDTGYFKFGNFMKLDANGFELKLTSGKTVETAISDAKTEAATAATTYTNTKTDEAKTYAEEKASDAQAAAEAVAVAQAALAETNANAYADGQVSAEETARIAEAEDVLTAAQGYADARAVDEAQAAKEYVDTVNAALAAQLGTEIDGLQVAWVYDTVAPFAPFDNMIWVDTTLVPNVPKRWVETLGDWIPLSVSSLEDIGAYAASEGNALSANFATFKQSFDNGEYITQVIDSAAFEDVLSGKFDKAEFATEFAQNAESITASVATVKATADGAAQSFETITNYMDFSGDGLLLGESGSALQVNITNEELQFLNANNKIAYINGSDMYITKANITEKIKIGVHELEKHDANITILRWVGEDN